MSEIKDGGMDKSGPAFPFEVQKDTAYFPGLSMRDYFAAKAMAGHFANEGVSFSELLDFELLDVTAKSFYEMADAMLAAREVKP